MGYLTLEPGRIPDETWRRTALALPEIERARLLSRADALRQERGGAAVASACYRFLRDDLDPARDRDGERFIWLLGHTREADPTLEEMARRAADMPRGTALWIHGQLYLAQIDRAAGRLDESTWRLTGLLRAVSGRDDAAEGIVSAKLALLLAQQGRTLEGYLVGRRAVALLEATTNRLDLLRAKLVLAAAYAGFLDWENYDRVRASILDEMQVLPPDEQREIARGDLVLRMNASAERGAFGETIAIVEELERQLPDPQRSVLRSYRTYLLFRLRRDEEACRLFDEVVAAGGPPPGNKLRFATTRVLCSLSRNPPEERRAALERYVQRIEKPGHSSAGDKLELLRGVLVILEERSLFPDLRKRMYDVGAACVLDRLTDLDRFAREDFSLFELNLEEREELMKIRTASLDRYGELRNAVVRLLEERHARGEAMPSDWYQDSGFLAVCAWCARVLHRDGTWVPVGSYLPEDPRLRVTHGMCPECERDVRSSRRARS